MDTAIIGMQAAMAAAAAGVVDTAAIPADGESFSAVLAGTVAAETGGAETITEKGSSAVPEDAPKGDMLEEAVKNIESLDETIRDALRMLLKRVIDALKGSQDGTERKTDLFAVIFVSDEDFGELLSTEDIPDADLLCAKILNRLGEVIESGISEDMDAGDVIKEIEDIVSAILGTDDDTDENAAAEAVAAMLGVPAEALEDYTFEAAETQDGATTEVKTEAVQKIAEAFKAPMEAVKEAAPEKVPEAEKLYSEFAAEVAAKTEEAPETAVQAGFAAYRVNDAGEQVNAISEKAAETEASEAAETVVYRETKADDTAEDKNDVQNGYIPEAAAMAAQPEMRVTETEIPETETVTAAYEPADIQVRETILEEISDMPDRDGVKELVLILRPKELGQVAVKLTKENGVLSVMLSAQYNEVGKMLADRAAQLGNALQDGDVKVKSVDVVEPGNAAEQMGLNFTDRGFGFTGGQNRGAANGGGNGVYGADDAEEATENIEIIKEERVWWTTTA